LIAGAFSSTSGKADTVLDTNGQILYYNNGRKALDKEDNDDVLTLKSGLPSWEAAGGGGLAQSTYSEGGSSIGAAQTRFYALGAPENFTSVTESPVEVIQDVAAVIVRMHVVVQETSNSNNTVTLRDDGADAVQITITASTTGDYDSGALTTAIAAGSAMAIEYVAAGSGGTQVVWSVKNGLA